MKDTYVATCSPGMEEVLKLELEKMGFVTGETGRSIVYFDADQAGLYRANMALRTAVHILKPIKTLKVKEYNMLYFQAKKINWHKLFDADKSIRISVKGKSSLLTHSQFVTHKVKDAIVDTFRNVVNERPSVDKGEPDIHIVVYLNETNVTLYLDSSGSPLFKRGYRAEHGEAPLKEDLAAGILLLAGYDGTQNLLDPMCGSGTFLVEAAMIAAKRAPNLNRSFSFVHWPDYDSKLHADVRSELEKEIIQPKSQITGFDKDEKTCSIARKIIKDTGFESLIKITRQDFLKYSQQFPGGLIVTNPPYDERMKLENDLEFYKQIGDFLKNHCKGSKAAVFTANLEAAKFIGLRSKKRIILQNGPLEARLILFDLF